MPTRRIKWHHRVLGTVDQRRQWRDVMLRRVGLARTRVPMELVRRRDLDEPNVVRALAADLLLSLGSLHFVQVGAFDGSSDDDLTTLVPLGDVRGVLVEPQPEPFAKLQERYAGESKLRLANVAIAANLGELPFYRPRSGASRLASFDRANLLRHGVAESEITSQPVRCLPLDALLAEVGFTRLDVLQVDAEGYDLEVLATLDFDRWSPSVVRIEYLHLDEARLDAWIAGLADCGYQFLVQSRDLVAVRDAELQRWAA